MNMTQGRVRRAPRASKTQVQKIQVGQSTDKPYHHGPLPQALVDAAKVILRRNGIRGLTEVVGLRVEDCHPDAPVP
jgi:hypothetical protein